MGIITFNGIESSEYGIVVEHEPNYEIPERIYEKISIPGRSGVIIVDTGSYDNVVRSYDIAFGAEGADFVSLATKVSKWLYSGFGYLRLEDSYNPDVFMYATLVGGADIENILAQAGRCTIEFDRQPQRFLKSGERAINMIGINKIENPTDQISKPLLHVRCKTEAGGTINVNGVKLTINNTVNDFYIDCDLEDAYKGSVNYSRYIAAPNGFPTLKPGNNVIEVTGNVELVDLTPRWWII